MNNQNTSKTEGLIVVRDSDGKIIAIASRLEGESKYEVYSVSVIAVDDLVALLNQKSEIKL